MPAKTNREKGKPPNKRKAPKKKKVNTGHKPKEHWSDAEREASIADYILSGNVYKTARNHGVPESTLRSWITESEKSTEVANLRDIQRAAMCGRAWEIINMGMSIIGKRFAIADERTDELERLIEEIFKTPDMEPEEKVEIAKKIAEISLPSVKDISGIVTAMYDKQEHAATGIDPSKRVFDVNITIKE